MAAQKGQIEPHNKIENNNHSNASNMRLMFNTDSFSLSGRSQNEHNQINLQEV